MERFREIQLEVWREACRHIEIGESTARILPLLRRQMPVGAIAVRLVERARGWIETIAAPADAGSPAVEPRTECAIDALTAIVDWCGDGRVAWVSAGCEPPAALAPAIAQDRRSDVLVGPLRLGDDCFGLLLLYSHEAAVFSERDQAIAAVLLDPLAAAVHNDRQLREMTSLRQAAEADKRSLLRKLGRERVGDTVVGRESGLRAVIERVELVARSDVPALILGETGSGKELIARTIHNRSARRDGPFVRVNCGAIPSELIDSQLFGHEKGAFTGAVETRSGWFERADGGTLFLDEIGELPLPAQVRLLRVLQDGWLERVGGHQPIRVDVRIVAATHRDLAGMVAESRFREDLWYRIAVFPIFLPPLRERTGDIQELAVHFAQRAATRFGLRPVMPDADQIALLQTYAWPGNVRELGTVIDRAAILGDGRSLEIAAALGVSYQSAPARPPQNDAEPTRKPRDPSESSAPRIPTLDEAMKSHIETALRAANGRIEGPHGAAAILKINPHTLRARMRKLAIDWRKFRPDGSPY